MGNIKDCLRIKVGLDHHGHECYQLLIEKLFLIAWNVLEKIYRIPLQTCKSTFYYEIEVCFLTLLSLLYFMIKFKMTQPPVLHFVIRFILIDSHSTNTSSCMLFSCKCWMSPPGADLNVQSVQTWTTRSCLPWHPRRRQLQRLLKSPSRLHLKHPRLKLSIWKRWVDIQND